MPSRKRCLELFKGTGSVGRVCEELGYDVVSLDINPRYDATYCCDILNFRSYYLRFVIPRSRNNEKNTSRKLSFQQSSVLNF